MTLLATAGCLVVLFDMEDFGVVSQLLPTTGLHSFHPFEFATLETPVDIRTVDNLHNGFLPYVVGFRSAISTRSHLFLV